MRQLVLIVIMIACTQLATAQHEHHQPAPKKAPAKKAAPAKVNSAKKNTTIKPKPSPQKISDHKAVATSDTNAVMTHDHHAPAADQPIVASDTAMGNHSMHESHDMSNMSHAFSLNLPMTRNGSGTGWLPDESPMFGYMMHSRKWMFMIHGNIFLRYNMQDVTEEGSRGDAQFDVPNMIMFMGQRRVGAKGLFHFSTMVSFDNLVTGGRGYPLLFQSGETHEGKPLVDRQHPHDLFSELSVSYSHAFTKDLDAFVYLGYPGEPALGPVTFMHRPSGWDNPDAPLSHHWIDATHITFGVATLGVRYKQFKLEGSSFTGREPDENRYNFDKPRFDSRSVRLSFSPGKHWALQASHAFIKSPETLHDHDVYRSTASATYARRFGNGLLFNATGLWGVNKVKGHDGEHAALLEASFRKNRVVGYTRYEWVQKSVEELSLDEDIFGHDHIFPIHALTLGGAYDLLRMKPVRTSIGAQATLYRKPSSLDALYGQNPFSAEVYLRIYPELMQ